MPRRVVYATTIGASARAFLGGQLRYLSAKNFDVHLVSHPDSLMTEWARSEGAAFHALEMSRDIGIGGDGRSLVGAIGLIRRLRPDTVVYGTPKASLLFALASFVCRVEVRVHVIHGLRWTTLSGWRRLVVRLLESVPSALATRVLAVSPATALDARPLTRPRARPEVIASGSANGISIVDPGPRDVLDLPSASFVVGFVGRVSGDKGIGHLVTAFIDGVLPIVGDALLVLVGPDDPVDPVDDRTRALIDGNDRILAVGHVSNARSVLTSFDVVVLPTLRDGFGYVCLEAAIEEVPLICSSAAGAVGPLVVDGVTGWVVPPSDPGAVSAAILDARARPETARHMARAAKARAVSDFSQERVWEFMAQVVASPKER